MQQGDRTCIDCVCGGKDCDSKMVVGSTGAEGGQGGTEEELQDKAGVVERGGEVVTVLGFGA